MLPRSVPVYSARPEQTKMRVSVVPVTVNYPIHKEAQVSAEDKMKNMAEKAKGKAKEATGKVTGNEEKQAEGQADQAKADFKQAGENVKDAFK